MYELRRSEDFNEFVIFLMGQLKYDMSLLVAIVKVGGLDAEVRGLADGVLGVTAAWRGGMRVRVGWG